MPDPVAGANEIRSRAANQSTIADILGADPERGFLRNLENQRLLSFMFNPVQLRESYAAVYARHSAPGMSHERLQFMGNKNARIPLNLVFDEYVTREAAASEPTFGSRLSAERQSSVSSRNSVDTAKRILMEMIYPRRSQRLSGASPAPILFVWPGLISMRVRVMRLQFNHIMFATGRPLSRVMTAQIDLEEDVERRMFASDQFEFGTIRPWAASTRPRRIGV